VIQLSSAIPRRGVRVVAAAVVLLFLAVLARQAPALPSSDKRPIAVSLASSATAVPLGGTFGFTGTVHVPAATSYVQARLQVHLPSGRLVFQRTQYEPTPKEGVHTYSFSRPLEGLGLQSGSYPVTFSLQSVVDGSDVTTEVTTMLRVYDPKQTPVPVVLLAKIHTRPQSTPEGRFIIDPASSSATRARDEIDRIAAMVLADPSAKVSLSIAPITLAEWRRMAGSGYTLTSGTVVPANNPVPVSYGAALAHLQQALSTGRLELLTMGNADPNLADLDANKLDGDVGAQYDEGLSACYASIETTPSSGTAPAGGCVPRAVQGAVLSRGVTYTFADSQPTRIGKRTAATGVYPAADSSLTVIVVDSKASKDLDSGDASATITRAFDRLGGAKTKQPVALRIDLTDSTSDATATVGLALAAVESTPWMTLILGKEARAPRSARKVSFVPSPTRHAPANFWSTVRSARVRAIGLIAALSSSDDQASSAQANSLTAESSAWADPSATWAQAATGLSFARAALRTAEDVFGAIQISAEQITFAGATGNVPVNVRNNSKKTLTVVLQSKAYGGVRIAGSQLTTMTLPPRETFVQIPVDMRSVLHGQIAIQVMAGSVVVAKQTVTVRRSYLDRLAFIGGIILVLGGMLGWIVLRVRTSPDIDDDGPDGSRSRRTRNQPANHGRHQKPRRDSGGHDDLPIPNDDEVPARYTESHPAHPIDSDKS